jgi:hypothetical protein
MRCDVCFASTEAVRARLHDTLEQCGYIQSANHEFAIFRTGKKGAIHSEPDMSNTDRVFVNLIPGTEDELQKVMSKSGMPFPRCWSVSNANLHTKMLADT